MITAKARAVDGPDTPFRAAEIKRRDLDLHDVLIEIKYAYAIQTSILLMANGDL
jgi:alcohol dehydrogenase (NADP+)